MPRPEPSIPLHQVDAFTDRAFAGNPAAVCRLERPGEPDWMQRLAREMNLSETAFLVPRVAGEFDLRWFTPRVEVDLCGHATLASAHFLWDTAELSPEQPAVFHTRSGVLRADRDGDWIVLDFPADPVRLGPAPEQLADALGGSLTVFGRSRLYFLAEVADQQALRALRPDFDRLERQVPVGVVVTSPGEPGGYDFYSRFFGPAVGVPEDPVTGSAHCLLAPYWAARLGRDRLLGFQASERGGEVRVHARGERVELAGRAVTVLRGALSARAAAGAG